ncbi:hypothetical protein F2Q69_00052138 [Brassica cretica]|uniref:Uncharacterized protein n=1 Tax=Brassica cretica TaxID=69181 RepID=A0A8S9MRM1_BRACR|nr:hypothetical protein F2Q69_00052138 [Brassica cretica]
MSFGGSHWCRSTPNHEHRSTEVIQNRPTSSPGRRSTIPTESTTSCKAVRIMTHEEFAAKHPHPPSLVYINIDRHSDPTIDRHQKIIIDRKPQAPMDRRALITYRVQIPKIDVARLNALKPKPKPSENPPETAGTPPSDGVDPMDVDRVAKGRNLRKRKEKCRSTPNHEHPSTEVIQNRSTSSPGCRSTIPTESTASCKAVRIMTHEEFAAKHPHPPSLVYINIDRHSDPTIDRHSDPTIDRHQEIIIDRQPQAPMDRRASITYRVQIPKIDVARLNALKPKPKPSENP